MFEDLPNWLSVSIEIAVLLVVSMIFYIVLSQIFKRSLAKLSPSVKDYNRKITAGNLFISSLKYFVVVIVVVGILVICGVEVGAIITGAGLLSIAIGFGAQSLVNDVISGFFIFFEKQYDVGDVVLVEGFTGEVISLGFKSTVLQNWLGDVFVIGNGKISSVTNFSQANSMAIVKVKVEPTTDFNKLQQVIEDALKAVVSDYDYFVGYPEYKGVNAISSSGIQVLVTAQTQPMRHFEAERVIKKALLDLFESEQIKFSCPTIEYKGARHV